MKAFDYALCPRRLSVRGRSVLSGGVSFSVAYNEKAMGAFVVGGSERGGDFRVDTLPFQFVAQRMHRYAEGQFHFGLHSTEY